MPARRPCTCTAALLSTELPSGQKPSSKDPALTTPGSCYTSTLGAGEGLLFQFSQSQIQGNSLPHQAEDIVKIIVET